MDAVGATACAINVFLPAALREARTEIETLQRENRQLHDELQRAHQRIRLLHQNIQEDRDELERAQLELNAAIGEARRLSDFVWRLSYRLY